MICHSVQAERNGPLLARARDPAEVGRPARGPRLQTRQTWALGTYLGMPPYKPPIRYDRYSRAPPCITYSLVPSRLTSIDSPNGELPVPRNPELKPKFPFGNRS